MGKRLLRKWALFPLKNNISRANSFLAKFLFTMIGLIPLLLLVGIVITILVESRLALVEVNWSLFSFKTNWDPASADPSFNILPMLLTTFYVALLAVVIAFPISLGCALFFVFYLKPLVRQFLLSFIDLLAGIPSVIFGFIGLTVLVKYLEKIPGVTSGESVLAAGSLLSIMLLPFMISALSETIQQKKARYYTEALALGLAKEIIILKIILQDMRPAYLNVAITALGRGLGETMAVMMVIGNSPIFPTLTNRAQTIPSLTALEIGNATHGSLHLSVIYCANLVLICSLALIYAVVYWLQKRGTKHD